MRFLLSILLTLNLTTLAQTQPPKPTPTENARQAKLALVAELEAQLAVTHFDIKTLRASGLAEGHPKLAELKAQTKTLEQKIKQNTPAPEETLILIEDTNTTSILTRKPVSLENLFKQGWHIHTLTPAGENKTIAWLKK